ncbi:UDP-N,N'-diacetylbacillosamine 2-epimerase (hydrolyzing) [Crenothrix polyspora]|uniref:UDP-N,N'-diacetylbacillosamine 2-epimerase (Hydrolyzing) n=1 Tax=Crenothrix polyspora TaxID=360316 RepID=A0A1R4HB74_9GAMM|nr:UDP-N-acetylglucosamine 2-epimerase [Crenothrix polyspora]SJM93120.1 UDP-N,N'-diacetylbacillosamine 2-epimerase (hydrolyzing) [Crenothrix polyspora]
MTGIPRKICYISGTRADFGLMQTTLQAIQANSRFNLSVVATGMHLSEQFGLTVREIEAAGLTVSARIPVDIEMGTGAAMARNLAKTLDGCVTALETLQPDMMIVLGDRGEMLAGAIAAIHLNIPIVHIHGGERSGTVDEPVRHAISKLSHYHFVATPDARERLIRMGERSDHVFVTGAPGLDGLLELANIDRAALCASVNFDADKPLALFVYHPVLQEANNAEQDVSALLDACLRQDLQILALMPNSDAGNGGVRSALEKYAHHPHLRVLRHLPRAEFVSWMAVCEVMIGNSSSGIIEAASFGTPVLNVGTRQNLRERNANITDIHIAEANIDAVLRRILDAGRFNRANVYGQGDATKKIVDLLASLEILPDTLLKANVY